jgi:hypothetical protein
MSAANGSSRVFLRGLPDGGPRRSLARRRRRPATAASLLLWALAAQPSRSKAAEADFFVALHYGVDAEVRGCWEEAEFRRSVARRLGYDPFRDDAAIDVQVRVGGAANAVDGHVDWRKANGTVMGERRFVAKDANCAKLLTEMSFAVALQIELLRPKPPVAAGSPAKGGSATSGPAPSAAAVAAPPPSVSSPAAPPAAGSASAASPAPAPPPAAPSPAATKRDISEERATERPARKKPTEEVPPPAPESAAQWSMWVGVGPSLAWRISPAVTGDARMFFGVRRGDLSLEIGAEATYPSSERRWDGSGFRQTLIGGALSLCGHLQSLSACALGRASQVRVTGLGVDSPRSPAGFAAQAGLRLAGTIELGGSWFAAVHLDGLGLLNSCTVVLNEAPVWEMPRLGLLAGIDVSARFR